MSRQTRKLSLNLETLRALDASDLGAVAGGKFSNPNGRCGGGKDPAGSKAAVCNSKNCTQAPPLCAASIGCVVFTIPGMAC